MTRVAVVGHVEWVHFLRVARLPLPGEIVRPLVAWAAPAGGGAMAALEMLRQGADTHFFTALGDDDVGRAIHAALRERGLEVHAAWRTRTAHPPVFTYLTDDHERTITLTAAPLAPSGQDALPWELLASTAGVYFCKGDASALAAARRAGVLVATARVLPTLRATRVGLDVLIGSSRDADECYERGELDPEPAWVVRTDGGAGGTLVRRDGSTLHYGAAPLPGEIADSYGCGDSFAGALTFARASGQGEADALACAALAGARALCRAGGG